MLHSWMDSRMAEDHRRELTSSAAAMVASWNDNGLMDPDGATDHLAAAAAAPGPLSAGLGRYRTEGGLLRRPFGQQVGTLLIRAGTRLGGASMRTS
jgi:hypothetical protein